MTRGGAAHSVKQVIVPPTRDLGGFEVRRALPSPNRRMVGPFIFLDSFGPVQFDAGDGLDSRPHPHIGLSTLSYLLAGELLHRDSEGFVQRLGAGEINLMTAGRGIVHSERTPADQRQSGALVHGIQIWIALPVAQEEVAPGFQHVSAGKLPLVSERGISLRLLAGQLEGLNAPTHTFSDLFNADLTLAPGARYQLSREHIERAAFVIDGEAQIERESQSYGKDQPVVFQPGADVVLTSRQGARLMVLGGEPLAEPRHVFWNFVSSRKERISQAADDWRERRFPGVPGDDEFTPLPEPRVPV